MEADRPISDCWSKAPAPLLQEGNAMSKVIKLLIQHCPGIQYQAAEGPVLVRLHCLIMVLQDCKSSSLVQSGHLPSAVSCRR